ncbi:MAG: ribosome recycling factor [Candidatus Marinimicrobia bacterium]|jgi:ribosome recycling factor|nr:ribosome recycling factor [Candidatus Neomarinimicrobiota bacterium]MBT3502441.1 ribosome recycling factor [Candidatus Neomarinimicrobiota bacterium]MBT3838761.1 ribosome recycling factor [Candidatus Neomarinimicrobiota bacterium]MBT3999665.1 ribosome recycling factor [Candidatus Neomarinimicrobiota bacterium]MBT4578770.1 ribosome recycling factor [Candidatus Neomarinimicrobiota bacterium]
MIEDILKDIKHRMDQAVVHCQGELNKVRTGRANPEMFNSLTIDYYGSMTPLNQVATISVPEPRLITLTPYEKTLIPIIEKAIINANMGFMPGNNGTAVLIPIPPLSEERRQELNKFVHQLVEEGRISIRNVRRDGIHHLQEFGKDDHVSEDLIKDYEGDVQNFTDNHIKKLNTIQDEKEIEILEV